MSRWTHILSLWLGSEISSAIQKHSQPKQTGSTAEKIIEDLDKQLYDAYEDMIELATEAEQEAAAYRAQIAGLNKEIAKWKAVAEELETQLKSTQKTSKGG